MFAPLLVSRVVEGYELPGDRKRLAAATRRLLLHQVWLSVLRQQHDDSIYDCEACPQLITGSDLNTDPFLQHFFCATREATFLTLGT
jgi:hypothetical protein